MHELHSCYDFTNSNYFSFLDVLHRLVHDKELQLYDGTRLLRHDRYEQIRSEHNLSESQMEERKIFKIKASLTSTLSI
jgi:hypothetical protein